MTLDRSFPAEDETRFHFTSGSFDGISKSNIVEYLGHRGITLHFRYTPFLLSTEHKSSPQRDNNRGSRATRHPETL